jgi:hypothetical protein
MSNEFFTPSGSPENSAAGSALEARAEFSAIAAGFDKLPPMAGNGSCAVLVNASGTALVADDYPTLNGVSWTPTLTCVTPGDLAITYTSQQATYSRVGQLVCYTFFIQTSAFTHTTASGTIYLSGMPISPTGGITYFGTCVPSGYTKANYTHVQSFITNANIFFYASGSAQPAAVMTITDFPTAGTVILAGQIFMLGLA